MKAAYKPPYSTKVMQLWCILLFSVGILCTLGMLALAVIALCWHDWWMALACMGMGVGVPPVIYISGLPLFTLTYKLREIEVGIEIVKMREVVFPYEDSNSLN
jgi:hypothetical protein